MNIITADGEYTPKNFSIHSFYGIETCFCWNGKKLVVFPYEQQHLRSTTSSLTILIAPAQIKDVQCYSQRIFIVCSPCGVYKLSRDREFFVLSKTAIAVGKAYFEVLIPKGGSLYLDSKQDKSSKLLFQLAPPGGDKKNHGSLSFFTLDSEYSSQKFRSILCEAYAHGECRNSNERASRENLCIIANEKKLLLLTDESAIKLFYNADYPVVDIKPIMGQEVVADGLLLVLHPGNSFVAVRAIDHERKIIFQKIRLETKPYAVCAGIARTSVLWMVHTGSSGTYYCQWINGNQQFLQKKISEDKFVCLRGYKSETIIGLTECKKLIQLPLNLLTEPMGLTTDRFVRLKYDMFKDTDSVINEICRKAEQLHFLSETWQNKQEDLRKINMYVYKQSFNSPRMWASKISNRPILTVDFEEVLPRETRLAVSARTVYQQIFCIKTINTLNTKAEIEVPVDSTAKVHRVSMDLIALCEKNSPWFVLKEFPLENQTKKCFVASRDRLIFLSAKLKALKRAIANADMDMRKLMETKRNMRKELLGT